MNDLSINETTPESLQALKRLTATVYLCQVLTFAFFGVPILIGAAINFFKRKEVQGTWLKSHFDAQIKTTWIALAGFAISGLTFEFGIGFFTLIITVLLMIYRIAVGWYALTDNKPLKD
ncbi:MAG: hypothetical protein CTY34_09865 [Methylobacter sp.]|nr:MAG: hypothetical protein CTY34_09865 [Methylobacter sp.]PPD02870.1 MAG: hypothetical protein CTY29_11585 [Methylobacter sp.]PPD23947.1 MAG: hypothetical protein CTY24_02680 [Methylobacter sp.]